MLFEIPDAVSLIPVKGGDTIIKIPKKIMEKTRRKKRDREIKGAR